MRVLAATAMIVTLIVVGMICYIPTAAQLDTVGKQGGDLVVQLLLAVALIIAVGRLGGWLARCLGQPRVMGEMVAGISLGPSLLGMFLPDVQRWLFPPALIPYLDLFAQLIIILFVFLLGAKLPLGLLRGSGRRVTLLGVGMVIVPVICGILLATGLSGAYRPDGMPLFPFLLFVGVALGVTAFPVLARILDEHGLTRSRIGTLGLTAAGIGDAVAWGLLVVAVAAIHDDSSVVALRTAILLIAFVVAVWWFFRPALHQFLTWAGTNTVGRVGAIPVLFLSALSGAFITDQIGVHAIFGAFLTGLAVPRDSFLVKNFTQSLERGVSVALPLFFVVVGLNVQIGLLGSLRDLLVCGLVLVLAVTSKIGTTIWIARSTQLPWRDSVGLGVMMNCRGLTELVVITAGLSLGIIEQDLFVTFVVMTLVTTMMTGPLLGRLGLGKDTPGTEPTSAAPQATVTSASASG